MSRIRTVKPELFRHELLYETEIETQLPIRICFVSLFTVCDRKGRFRWRPRQLKLDCLPYDDIDFSRVLDALVTRGFIVRYENSGDEYGCIPSFEKHQVINNREMDSILPDMHDEQSHIIDCNDDLIKNPRVSHASATRQPRPLSKTKGNMEGKRNMEGNMESASLTRGAEAQKNNAKKKQESEAEILERFGITGQIALDFIQHRKSKKAPITETALNKIKKETELTLCKISLESAIEIMIMRGWVGFSASWIENNAGEKHKKDNIPRDENGNVVYVPSRMRQRELRAEAEKNAINGMVTSSTIEKGQDNETRRPYGFYR